MSDTRDQSETSTHVAGSTKSASQSPPSGDNTNHDQTDSSRIPITPDDASSQTDIYMDANETAAISEDGSTITGPTGTPVAGPTKDGSAVLKDGSGGVVSPAPVPTTNAAVSSLNQACGAVSYAVLLKKDVGSLSSGPEYAASETSSRNSSERQDVSDLPLLPIDGSNTNTLSLPALNGEDLSRKSSFGDLYPDSEKGDLNGELNKSVASTGSEGRKKRKPNWYNVLSPTYKSKCEDFKRIFKDIPSDERLMVDYSCALQRDILVHGRLYITQNWICFYANIFRWETQICIRCRDITAMTKEKTARVIPNAVQIITKTEKLFFTSFGARDKTYLMLFRVWQNALMEQPMVPQEMWQWVHYSYGEELGLTSSDDDYIAPSSENDKTSDTPHSPPDSSLDQPSRTKTVSSLPVEDILVSPILDEDPDDFNSPPSNNDDDLPTDLSDNTDCSDQEEIVCSGHEHAGLTTVDEVFNMTVDEMFTNLFTGSAFYVNLQNAKKTQDMELCDWPEEPDADGHLRRVITYTLTLNNPLGPKNSYVREVQTRSQHSKPGTLYIIDCEVNNSGVPYGDNFYVTNRYCITKAGTLKCRLRVSCQIKYRKNVWGVVKNFIDKNVTQGLTEHFSMLANMLRKECNERIGVPLETHVSNSSIKKRLRRRRRLMTELNPSPSRLPDVTAVNHVSSRLHGRSRSRSNSMEMSRSVERSSSIRWKEAKSKSCEYESKFTVGHLKEELVSSKSLKYAMEKSKSIEILNSNEGVEMYVCNCEGCKANVATSEGISVLLNDALPRSNSCPNSMSKWDDPLPEFEPLSAMKVVPAENRMRWEENNDETSAKKNIASNAHRNPFSRSRVRVKSYVQGHGITAFLPFIQVLWTFAIVHERVSIVDKLSPSNVTLPWRQRDSIATKIGEIVGDWYN